MLYSLIYLLISWKSYPLCHAYSLTRIHWRQLLQRWIVYYSTMHSDFMNAQWQGLRDIPKESSSWSIILLLLCIPSTFHLSHTHTPFVTPNTEFWISKVAENPKKKRGQHNPLERIERKNPKRIPIKRAFFARNRCSLLTRTHWNRVPTHV